KGFGKCLVRAIEPQRRHRNIARRQCPEIRALFRNIDFCESLETDPEIRIAAAVAPLIDFQKAEIALALSRHAYAFDFAWSAGGKIDVDHRVLRHARTDHLAQDRWTEFERGVPHRIFTRLRRKFLRQSE